MRTPRLPLLLALLAACSNKGPVDADRDGVSAITDCDDAEPRAFPGRAEECDGVDNDCDGAVDEGYDEDADVWKTCGERPDCDDTDPAVHPDAEEPCDGIDNDCDGIADDGAIDADADTFCGPNDCNDGSASIHPGADELCDGVDNDCDSQVDEGFDEDGDGTPPCTGDCDDSDATVSPDATEICDGVDNDCDGTVDDGFDGDQDGFSLCDSPPDCDDQRYDVYPGAPELCDGDDNDCDTQIDEDAGEDADGDGWGACDGDCDDNDPAVRPGGFELPDGQDNDCDGTPDDGYGGTGYIYMFPPTVTGTVAQGGLGLALSDDGDVNGDGRSDFLVGAPLEGNDAGKAYLFLGTPFNTATPPATLSAFATITGQAAGDRLGQSLALVDLDGDGYDDIVVGKPQSGSASPPAGVVHIYWGSPVMSGGNWPLSGDAVTLTGAFSTEQCGTAVADGGDVNGDGYQDLLVGCPWYDPGGGTGIRGRVLVVFGRARASWSASMTSTNASASILGDSGETYVGEHIVGNFDFNDDGYSDIAIGSPSYSSGQGRVGVRYGAATGWTSGQSLGAVSRVFTSTASAQGLGSVLAAGNISGDSKDELVLGLPSVGNGRTAVLPGGSASGSVWSLVSYYLNGPASGAQCGAALAVADLDGDGRGDVVTGTPAYDGSAGSDQGAFAIIDGPGPAAPSGASWTTANAGVVGQAQGDALGTAMTALADFNGDGAPDVIVAAPYQGSNDVGRLYFVPGF